jgi:hypothetical protein
VQETVQGTQIWISLEAKRHERKLNAKVDVNALAEYPRSQTQRFRTRTLSTIEIPGRMLEMMDPRIKRYE